MYKIQPNHELFIFAYFEKAVENTLANIYLRQIFYLLTRCHCITLQLSDAWLISFRCRDKNEGNRKKELKIKKIYFEQKSYGIMVSNLDIWNWNKKYLKNVISKVVSFIFYQHINFDETSHYNEKYYLTTRPFLHIFITLR